MTQLELLNKIKYLIPDAKCSIHELDDENIDENETQAILSGYRVSWNASNVSSCPTQNQLNKVTIATAKQESDKIAAESRKEQLKKDPVIRASFLSAKAVNPYYTIDEFINDMDALEL